MVKIGVLAGAATRTFVFLKCVLWPGTGRATAQTMPLWEDFQRVTTSGGVFEGTSEALMINLVRDVHTHQSMRFLSDGTPVNRTQADLFERTFRDKHGLDEEQFVALLDIYDRSTLSGCFPRGAPEPVFSVGAGESTNTRACLAPDRNRCCGFMLRTRWIGATVYERDRVYPAWNITKSCRAPGGCGRRYLYDKTIAPGRVGTEACYWHVYRAWTGGELPKFISSKSGHAIVSTALLHSVAVVQATSRAAFQTQATSYNATVARDGGNQTVRLTGSVLLECLTLLACLKQKQCRGPFRWVPPPGGRLVADRPQEVSILDMRGGLSGASHWVGLRALVDEVLEEIAEEGLWSRHSCLGCCQDIEAYGAVRKVHAAVADGLTAIRFAKCSFHGCMSDLLPGRGQRFCAFHAEAHGSECAVNAPTQCPHPREEGRLTCAQHRSWEDYYNRQNLSGGYHARATSRARGEKNETQFMKYLRSMFALRFCWGYLVVTLSCGIICGLAPLWESEGDWDAAWALNDLWRLAEFRPEILFYDKACFRRRYLIAHPDPLWMRTLLLVDRWHFRNHVGHGCGEYCSPLRQDCPLLYAREDGMDPRPRWNTSVAESSNSFLHGLGHCVKRMPRGLNRFVLTINTHVYNEILLGDKLLRRNPVFRT